jgi:hypothetical protein
MIMAHQLGMPGAKHWAWRLTAVQGTPRPGAWRRGSSNPSACPELQVYALGLHRNSREVENNWRLLELSTLIRPSAVLTAAEADTAQVELGGQYA